MAKKPKDQPPARATRPSFFTLLHLSDQISDHISEKTSGALISLFAFAIYLYTLYPTLSGGDSGELITTSYNLGVIHPPGFPLYAILAKIFTLIPIGNIAWRVNLLSASCSAGAVYFLHDTLAKLTQNKPAALVGSGLYAFSPLIWTYSIQAEVFALNNCLLSLLFYLALVFIESKLESRKWLFAKLGAFVIGLALSNHHLSGFFTLPLLLGILWSDRNHLLKPSRILILLGYFGLGLLPYLYLPLASLHTPLVSWGDSSTLSGFLIHLLRSEFGTTSLFATNSSLTPFGTPFGTLSGDILMGLGYYFTNLAEQSLYVGCFFAALGLVTHLPKWNEKQFIPLLFGLYVFYLLLFHSLANIPAQAPLFLNVTSRFWQQPNLIFYLFVGLGFAVFVSKLKRPLLSLSAALFLIGLQIAFYFGQCDQHRNYTFLNYGKEILEPLPRNALLLSVGDLDTNSIRYAQTCEKIRPDIIILDRMVMHYPWGQRIYQKHFPQIHFPGTAYALFATHRQKPGSGEYFLQDFISANLGQLKLYINDPEPREDGSWQQSYRPWAFGLTSLVTPKDQNFDLQWYLKEQSQWDNGTHQNKSTLNLIKIDPNIPEAGTWEYEVWEKRLNLIHRKAASLINYSLENGNDQNAAKLAVETMEPLMRVHPTPPPMLYKNLGRMYEVLSLYDPLMAFKASSAWTAYLEKATQTDPDLPKIQNYILAHPPQ